MINIIYVDMDGVLCNFEKRYFEKFGVSTSEVRRSMKHLYSSNWEAFVKDREFESLDWFTDAKELVKFLNSLSIKKEILSSTAGDTFYDFIAGQKSKWLDDHGIDWQRNFVPGRKYKKNYARKDVLLIDDTMDVVDSFSNANGFSILHRDVKETINLINIYTKVML
jgi:hypothetical protein